MDNSCFFILFIILHCNPGLYFHFYLPVFALVMGYVIVNLSLDFNRKFKNISSHNFSLLMIILCVLSGVTQFISPTISGIDYGNIQFEDCNSQYINQSLMEFNPGNTIVFLNYMTDLRNLHIMILLMKLILTLMLIILLTQLHK